MGLRHVFLGLLIDRPDHAYALKHRLSPGVSRDQLINDGILYPLLAKLEDDGLAESAPRPGRGGRQRRVYSVTPAGRREFGRWLRSEEDEGEPPVYELFVGHPFAKLLFAAHLSPEELREKANRQAGLLADRIALLESLGSTLPSDPGGALWSSLLQLETRHQRARLDWLRRAAYPPSRRAERDESPF